MFLTCTQSLGCHSSIVARSRSYSSKFVGWNGRRSTTPVRFLGAPKLQKTGTPREIYINTVVSVATRRPGNSTCQTNRRRTGRYRVAVIFSLCDLARGKESKPAPLHGDGAGCKTIRATVRIGVKSWQLGTASCLLLIETNSGHGAEKAA